MCEFEWEHVAFIDQARTESRSKTEEEHAPFRVTADRLHRRVVEHFRGLAEGCREIKVLPTSAKICGLAESFAALHRNGKANRDSVERLAR